MNYSNEFQKFAVKDQGISSLTMYDYTSAVNKQYSGVPGIVGLTPNIIEERQLNVVAMDVFSRLMMDRIIFLGMGINDQVANIVCAQLLFLQSTDAKKDINIYLNSPGGSVSAGLGIYDTMQLVTPDIATICTGMAASMGAVLLCAGTDGKRSALPHSRVMIHQPMGGAQGQASDIEIMHREIQKIKTELYQIISDHTKQPFEKIEKDSDRDYWMTSDEAKEYGLVDEVLAKRDKS
ncbi:MAG: ATP-dependent Clp protease proteolytic subunit [Bacteroidota bacterium]